ncbi:hypothetical protein LRR80_00811 [Streptomyces sp. RO-S4]|nr:hypothetical protein [Streptomyces sp. RO-S4]
MCHPSQYPGDSPVRLRPAQTYALFPMREPVQ